jgi:hypothetical protein
MQTSVLKISVKESNIEILQRKLCISKKKLKSLFSTQNFYLFIYLFIFLTSSLKAMLARPYFKINSVKLKHGLLYIFWMCNYFFCLTQSIGVWQNHLNTLVYSLFPFLFKINFKAKFSTSKTPIQGVGFTTFT